MESEQDGQQSQKQRCRMYKLAVACLNDSACLLYPKPSPASPRPLYGVPAGYPSAAQDYMEQELDIAGYLLGPRRASVFLFRIGGMSMKDAGILDGDIIIVDRSLEVQDGHIIVAAVDGAYTCKYYRKAKTGVWLVAANPDFKPMKISVDRDFSIFGRYDGLIRKDKPRNTKPFKIPDTE